MTRAGLALWLLAALTFVIGPATYLHLYPPKPTQCPPECARCGHAQGPSNKSWCELKNTEGMK